MTEYLREKNIQLISDGKYLLIKKDGKDTKYRISLSSLSFKQGLIRNLLILLESKDRDLVKGIVDSWYKEFKKGETTPINKEEHSTVSEKESNTMDFSVILKAFDDFKEEMREQKLVEESLYNEKDNLDYEVHWLKSEIEDLKDKHNSEKMDYIDQITELLLEVADLKERNEELEDQIN